MWSLCLRSIRNVSKLKKFRSSSRGSQLFLRSFLPTSARPGISKQCTSCLVTYPQPFYYYMTNLQNLENRRQILVQQNKLFHVMGLALGIIASGLTWGYVWYNWLRVSLPYQYAVALLIWGLMEIAFYFFQQQRYRICCTLSDKVPETLHYQEAFRRFLELSKFMQIEPFLQSWFLGTPYYRIKRGNAEEFFAYGFLYQNWDNLSREMRQWVKNAVREIEDKWNFCFPEGYENNLQFMAHLHEPLRVLHKPLAMYLAMESVGMLSCAVLWTWGFRFQRVNGMLMCWREKPVTRTWRLSRIQLKWQIQWPQMGSLIELGIFSKFGAAFAHFLIQYHNSYLTYKFDAFSDYFKNEKYSDKLPQTNFEQWTGLVSLFSIVSEDKPQSCYKEVHSPSQDIGLEDNIFYSNSISSAQQTPIVFMHGIGAGTFPYLFFVRKIMRQFPDNPLILTEMRHISMRWTPRAKSVNEVANSVATLMQELGVEKAHLIGHSYGTLVASSLVHRYRHLVDGICLMDPVCLMTCHPTLLQNFIYKGFGPGDTIIDYLRFMCARDISIAEGLCRNFWWSGLMLWPADFPSKTLLAVSGKDDLVPSDIVLQQLNHDTHPAKVLFNEKLAHGQFILKTGWMDTILTEFKSLLTQEQGCL
eukprot:TRINITY_DN814_c0_g1_i4.p1 TRINITY_DN814_c0_g1~~TRINITY_DN814_c0_g1_i4.p1  ORF type:complete len:642 (-),score=23.88 TRINITY_DN814_c0_g1_i4:347-2272(-)